MCSLNTWLDLRGIWRPRLLASQWVILLPPHDSAVPYDMENKEPTLQEILNAVHTYGSSLTELSAEVKAIKEGILHIRHDMKTI